MYHHFRHFPTAALIAKTSVRNSRGRTETVRISAMLLVLLVLSLPSGAKAEFSEDQNKTIVSLYELLETGDAETALQLAEATLAETRNTYGSKSPEVAVVLLIVARALHELDRLDKAETAYHGVITLLENNTGHDPSAERAFEGAWHALGQIYEKKGQLRESITARKQHLKLLDAKGNGNDAFSAVLDWMKIGDLYLNLSERQTAAAAYLEGVAIVPFVPTQIRGVPLFIHRRLAFIYRMEERYSKAEALLSRHEEAEHMANKVLRFYKRAGMSESGDSVRVMRLKARLLSEPAYKSPSNRSERALKLLTSALEIRRRESGSESLLYAKVLFDIASHHLKQHAFEAAEDVSREALAIYEDRIDETATSAGPAQQFLAQALEGQKRYAEALPFAEQALAVYRDDLPPYHRFIGETLSLLSDLNKALGRQDDYQEVRRQIAAFYEERARFMRGG